MKVLPVSAYLSQHITDIVISLLDIFNASGLVLVSIPAILNNGKAQIKPLTQLQQMVRLLAGPVVVMEMLLILQVRVGRHINSLLQMIASQNKWSKWQPIIADGQRTTIQSKDENEQG